MKFLIIDCGGIHVALAEKLAAEHHEVFYYNPYQRAYTKYVDFAPGMGIEGVTKVYDFGGYIDQADVVVFPDVGMGEFADYLRNQGKAVWGAGRAEVLEQDREKSVEILAKYGIKTPPTHTFSGVEEAYKFFEDQEGASETNQIADGKYFVKINIFRGSIDSFPYQSLIQLKDQFAKIRGEFGPYADHLPIIVQEKIEGTEGGIDVITSDGELLTPTMWGFESGNNYIGWISDLPETCLAEFNKIQPFLKETKYRGSFSTEWIVDSKGDHYWIDCTCRQPMPLGLLYYQFIPNLGEFIAAVARGETPQTGLPQGQYLGVAEISSENAIDDWLAVNTNEFCKLLHYTRVGGQDFCVPGVSTLGVVTAQGANFNEIKDNLDKNSEGVDAFFGKIDTNWIPELVDKYVEPYRKLGMDFGPGATYESVLTTNSRASQFLRQFRK